MDIKTMGKNKGLTLLEIILDFGFIELGLEVILGQNLYHISFF